MTHEGFDCNLGTEMYKTCTFVQIMGVTAAVLAFVAFLLMHRSLYINKDGIPFISTHVCICLLLILMAYLLAIVYFIIHIEDPNKILKLCWLIYCLDVFLLGGLVLLTGGTTNSLFSPLFLLIPAVACCFFSPKNKPFKFLIFAVLAIYVSVLAFEFTEINIFVKGINFSFEGIDTTTTFDDINDISVNISKMVKLLAGTLTAGCILISAYCYSKTHNIRNKCNEFKIKCNALETCNRLRL